MLSDSDKVLVKRAFAQGPAALYDAGLDSDQVAEFLAREDVKSYLFILERELEHAPALDVRQRYVTRRDLSRLTPGAVAVLGAALAGPQYLKTLDDNGVEVIQRDGRGNPILRRDEPTSIQLRAAETILEALGIPQGKARAGADSATEVNIQVLFREGGTEAVTRVSSDPDHTTEAQRALSRERIRTVIDQLATAVPKLHENLRKQLGQPRPKAPPGRKKATKKKAARRIVVEDVAPPPRKSTKPAKKATRKKPRKKPRDG
tara:strand:- start:5911 stop:6693 length:783 start_codon:yes stop_codon:yes gene_type:complete